MRVENTPSSVSPDAAPSIQKAIAPRADHSAQEYLLADALRAEAGIADRPEFHTTRAQHNVAVLFDVDKENRVVFKVLDQDTGEVLRQVPPEQSLKISAENDDMFLGSNVHKNGG